MENKVIIFTAPSGSGKSTVVQSVLNDGNFELSVSDTTREKRDYEVDGKHYNFVTVGDFMESMTQDSFIEYEEVYPDQFYGTLKDSVEKIWKEGKVVLFDVDVKGAIKLKEYFGDNAFSVFIKVPSIEVLTKRLYTRGTENDSSLRSRVDKFEEELQYMNRFDYILINDVLEDTLKTIKGKVDEWMNSSK
jgi:guanylate kinase